MVPAQRTAKVLCPRCGEQMDRGALSAHLETQHFSFLVVQAEIEHRRMR